MVRQIDMGAVSAGIFDLEWEVGWQDRPGTGYEVRPLAFVHFDRTFRAFAGDEWERAKYYERDAEFLVELEPDVVHFEVEVPGPSV